MTAVLRDDPGAAPRRRRSRPGVDVLGRLRPADARRLAEILAVLARHGVLTFVRTGGRFVVQPRRQPPKALAVALRRSFADLGPTFVKLGQLMASSPGLFPAVLAEEMRGLLDDVPAEPAARIRRIIERQLGQPVDALFAAFDDEPLAAASIAQVHRARLHDGTDVAVKVRRPRLRGRIERDLRLLEVLAVTFSRVGVLGEAANPVGVVEDLRTTTRQELDLRREARDMAIFGANLRRVGDNDGVIVPEPIDRMVGERVLVMTFIEGRCVDDVETIRSEGLDLEDLVRRGARAWFEGALVHGLFHGDMHAGNLFVTPAGEVAFLDFGIMGRLEATTRTALLRLLPAALVQRDHVAIMQAMVDLGAVRGQIDLERAGADVAALVDPLVDRPLGEVSYGEVLTGVVRVATQHAIGLPRELVLVVKQLLYFERYVKALAPGYVMFADPAILSHVLAATFEDDPPTR